MLHANPSTVPECASLLWEALLSKFPFDDPALNTQLLAREITHVLQPDTSSVDGYNAHCHEVDKAILALKHMTITLELLFAALEYAHCKTSSDSRLVAAHTKVTTKFQQKKKTLTTELVRDTVKARLHLPAS